MGCNAGYIKWIYSVFGECVINGRDKAAFVIGMISNLIWVVSSTPQMVQNCKTRIVEGISPFFFSLLFTGNCLSLIGLLINGGLVTQYITSVLYVLLDGFLFLQWVMFTYCCPGNKKNNTDDKEDHVDSVSETNYVSGAVGTAAALMISEASATNFRDPYNKKNLLGSIFGWIGAVIYIFSRVPQVIKNFKDHKVRDLSPFYVSFSIAGNGTYVLSLFIKSIDGDWLWSQTPWIVGSLAPMTCDIIFLIQMCVFGLETSTTPEKVEEEEEEISEDRRLSEL